MPVQVIIDVYEYSELDPKVKPRAIRELEDLYRAKNGTTGSTNALSFAEWALRLIPAGQKFRIDGRLWSG